MCTETMSTPPPGTTKGVDGAVRAMDMLTDVNLPLFLFYLLVFCNYTAEIIGCRLRTLLTESFLAKHLVGYVLLLFLVVAVDAENSDKDLPTKAAISAAVYALFLVTTRTPLPFTIAVLLMLMVTFVLGSTRKRAEKQGDAAKTRKVAVLQAVLTGASALTSVVGFVVYIMAKRKEYGSEFRFSKFVLGNKVCRKRD